MEETLSDLTQVPSEPTGVQSAPASPPESAKSSSGSFQHGSYLIRKKILKLAGKDFHVFDPSGQVVFFSRMKAFKLREDIRIYTDESMQTELLTIKARQIFDLSAAYDIVDSATGEKVGVLKRKGLKSMIIDEWIVMDANDQEIGSIKEDSMALALIRRFVINLIPQNFTFEIGGTEVCALKQNFNPFVSKITLDFLQAANGLMDKRLGIAAAILICGIEGKQD
jgi:hypothetical protein